MMPDGTADELIILPDKLVNGLVCEAKNRCRIMVICREGGEVRQMFWKTDMPGTRHSESFVHIGRLGLEISPSIFTRFRAQDTDDPYKEQKLSSLVGKSPKTTIESIDTQAQFDTKLGTHSYPMVPLSCLKFPQSKVGCPKRSPQQLLNDDKEYPSKITPSKRDFLQDVVLLEFLCYITSKYPTRFKHRAASPTEMIKILNLWLGPYCSSD